MTNPPQKKRWPKTIWPGLGWRQLFEHLLHHLLSSGALHKLLRRDDGYTPKMGMGWIPEKWWCWGWFIIGFTTLMGKCCENGDWIRSTWEGNHPPPTQIGCETIELGGCSARDNEDFSNNDKQKNERQNVLALWELAIIFILGDESPIPVDSHLQIYCVHS